MSICWKTVRMYRGQLCFPFDLTASEQRDQRLQAKGLTQRLAVHVHLGYAWTTPDLLVRVGGCCRDVEDEVQEVREMG